MSDNEPISDTFTRLTDIVKALRALGRHMPNVELLKKILPSLPHSWRIEGDY